MPGLIRRENEMEPFLTYFVLSWIAAFVLARGIA